MAQAYVALGVLGSMFLVFVVLCVIALIEFGPSCDERGEGGEG